ncbi:MAG TPA: alpha-ketoglutarate-dependent dioxygenase AlkB [Acidimicrobiaceae bacterium]|nr:alpha-ketoglutarate-dependent dioxygenase AlkB [Acidimicrobiaceae bacterium]HAY65356.1 alpha-ketoglutarate-dependent dioxygenase AlkB [Acidimicrobiaceae bacterium]HCK74940.1 alpha-ketoglutarate-dependent dioxygenase AlkB [Acidimicrobiaceae bacterium]
MQYLLVNSRSSHSQEELFNFGSVETLDLPGAEIELHQQIWSRSQGDTLCGLLIKELNWRQDKISMFGQTHDVPRLNAWYGDADCSYSWSGITMTPNPWNSTLRDIREKVNGVASEQFNSVLANFYRDGNDKVDWHADDEEVLGQAPVIASVSLGATRKFRIRRKDRSEKATDIFLRSGDVLVMRGLTQLLWEHEVPRSKKVKEPRVNLTFRKVALTK